MNQIKTITNVLALCTIVGLSCWIGYLLSANESKARTIDYYNAVDSVNKANIEIHRMDSITISKQPPVSWDIDSVGNYTFYYN